MTYNSGMQRALQEARKAFVRHEVPVGAVIFDATGACLAQASNRTIEKKDPTAHAEILAIQAACHATGWERLEGCTLYVTLEPCTMCAAAISFARVATLVMGAPDLKGGGVLHGTQFYQHKTCHYRPVVHSGILEKECAQLLRDFFKQVRQGKKKNDNA